ncbi:hypothetical protein EV188_101195 [Actinomycetospora succinea]|uniref:Flp pilus assembly protein CpaB n=1 Tax=Actinomycetospora succinea TaxID=663603 RepID=A0A4R6VQV7_9PSEU|nr:hypothetical protein EV188_101195 [Actinomycetospora succinea]
MAACACVLVLSGLVAVIAGAVGADRATAVRLAGEEVPAAAPAPPPRESSPAPAPERPRPAPERGQRVPDAVTATTLAVLPGWRVAPDQDVIEVPAGRFEDATILRRGANTVVLVGVADPARVPPRAGRVDPRQDAALDAEARRLVDAYVEQLAPGADTAALTDNAEPVAALPTRTSVRRVEGGPLDGALVRVSTIAAPGRTLAVLAVARPSPTVGEDGDAADAVVRSLRVDPA